MQEYTEKYSEILKDSQLDEENILEYLTDTNQLNKLDIALRYYQNSELDLEEYKILIEFFNYIDSIKVNELLRKLYDNGMIFSMLNNQEEGIINIYLRDRVFKSIASGTYHLSALYRGGKIYCWEDGVKKQCIIPKGRNFKEIACGKYFSVALDEDGQIHTWGTEKNYPSSW